MVYLELGEDSIVDVHEVPGYEVQVPSVVHLRASYPELLIRNVATEICHCRNRLIYKILCKTT